MAGTVVAAAVSATLSHGLQVQEAVEVEDDLEYVAEEEQGHDDEQHDRLFGVFGLLRRDRRGHRLVLALPLLYRAVDQIVERGEQHERDEPGDGLTGHVGVPENVVVVQLELGRGQVGALEGDLEELWEVEDDREDHYRDHVSHRPSPRTDPGDLVVVLHWPSDGLVTLQRQNYRHVDAAAHHHVVELVEEVPEEILLYCRGDDVFPDSLHHRARDEDVVEYCHAGQEVVEH